MVIKTYQNLSLGMCWKLVRATLRKAVQSKRRSNAVPDRKYEQWMPKQRFNVDQVPLPFVVEQDRTYELSGSKQVLVSQPSSGLDERQANLQLCIRAEGRQAVQS